MPWGVVAGAVIGGIATNKASKRATAATTQANELSNDEQRRQFDITQGNLQPFQQAGSNAINEQQNLLGLNGVDAQQTSYDAFNASPGQQFLRDRAQKNLLRNSAAIGGLGGGNVRSALVQQGVGFAQQDFQNQFGRLGQLAGQGQNAANSIGQFGANAANNISNSLMKSGEARASGIIDRSNNFNNTLNTLVGAYGQFG